MPTVRDIMTTDIVSVRPDTPVLDAYALLHNHAIDGVPVIEEKGKLVGILTEYDLLTKGSEIHLPTLQKILTKLPVYTKDQSQFRDSVQDIMKLTVRDVMNTDPLTLSDDSSLEQVVAAFRAHHRVNPIPIVDADKRVVGVVSRYDILKLFAMLRFGPEENGR